MSTLTTIPSRATTTLPCSGDPEAWYDPNQEATAKQGCSRCPVRDMCLTVALNSDEPWGVWGGYSHPERQRLTAGRTPTTCTTCGLLCVPADTAGSRCDTCTTSSRHVYDDRDQIAALTAAGHTVPQIAERLGWTRSQISQCREKFGIRSPRRGRPPADPALLQPCGTPAAYRRHHRRGEPIDAACEEANRRNSQERRDADKKARQLDLTATTP